VLAADWEPSTRPCDLLLDGLALLTREGYLAAAPALKIALRAFRDEPLPEEDELRWLWLACRIARALADDEAWDELTARHLELARRAGAFSALPSRSPTACSSSCSQAGLGQPCRSPPNRTPSSRPPAVTWPCAPRSSWRTGADGTPRQWRSSRRTGRTCCDAARGSGSPPPTGAARSATKDSAERAAAAARGLGPAILLLAELIEAAARSGQAERATGPLAQLAETAHAAGTDWALGTHARAAAMLAQGQAAERLYQEAIERLSRIKTRATLARAHLLYGEWLRREHRRVDAREQLRVAHEMLSDMGMEAYAERARRELQATGETARKRLVETLDELTPQEVQVARRAADGQTNPQIGAQLFLSPRTVEWHLTKVFGKLGIGSRKQLRSALSDVAQPVVRL
jgi:DNA-binding CsgD family transcriptional regulator